MFNDRKQEEQGLIGIIVVLIIVVVASGGFYYFSKNFFEVPEIKEIEKPAETPKEEEKIVPPEETPPPQEETKTEEPAKEEKQTPPSPPPCQDECSPLNSKKCSNNGYQVCGNYDDDECLEWSQIVECPADNICKNGVCSTKKCSDGTLYNQCSLKKPKYCDNGNLIDKCSLCGCPNTYFCQEDEKCIQCTEGPCCDTAKKIFRNSSYKCEENVNTEYGCPWQYERGSNVGVRYQHRYCSGSSAECNGALKWSSWIIYDDCPVEEACLNNSCQTYIERTLNVFKSGLGQGTVTSSPAGINCGNDCSEKYPLGTSVTLTAASEENSAFAGWSGDCTGTTKCTLKMDNDKTVTANFSPTFSLSINKGGTGQGTVTSSPAGVNCGNDCSEKYPLWTTVVLSAAPDANSVFSGWAGICSGTEKCQVVINGDRTVLAVFNQKTVVSNYTLSVSKGGTGSGMVISSPVGVNCGSDCSETYQAGTSVTLYTTALGGSIFGGWEGDCSGNETSCTLIMNSNKSTKAIFNAP